MAEERTMSAITKMNSPDRASQKVSTLFDMALIRQYYKREENTTLKKHRPRPTVRFADLSKHLDTRIVVANPHTSGSNIEDPSDSTAQDLLYRDIDELELEDEAVDCVEPRSRDVFEAEATDGIFLASKLLTDMLTDSSHSISASRSSPPVIVTPMQPQMHQPVDVSKLVY
ncbi:hypothetical protein FRC07_012497 [Ceratobasidium sp. 392]|nr:hypothetical protein FRC07_012497 [Ceratobasidium sp. 392]